MHNCTSLLCFATSVFQILLFFDFHTYIQLRFYDTSCVSFANQSLYFWSTIHQVLSHTDRCPVDDCNHYCLCFKYISLELNFFYNYWIFIGVRVSKSLMSDQLNTKISVFQCYQTNFTELHGVNNNASKNNEFHPLRHQFAKEYLRTVNIFLLTIQIMAMRAIIL